MSSLINIYSGGTTAVSTGAPVQAVDQSQPFVADPTQTGYAGAGKRDNQIRMLKALKEKIAAKLQQVENLHNELQLKNKQEKLAREKAMAGHKQDKKEG